MTSLSQLEIYTSELSAAVKSLVNCCPDVDAPVDFLAGHTPPRPLIPPDAPSEAHQARQTIMATAGKLQSLLGTPSDFVHQLSRQSQLLACLHWLCEFQVLACIPLSGSVSCKGVADLAGVPEVQLLRVVRMMATVGFLRESQPEHVAHSALSAEFVTHPSLLDAAMFLSETAAPAALHMAEATRRFGESQQRNESGYNVAFDTTGTFSGLCEQRPKLQRQWPAYLRHGTGEADDGLMDILARFDWHSIGISTVVEVGARSTTTASGLADTYPTLHFIVQMNDLGPSNRVSRQAPWTGLATPASTSRASEFSPSPNSRTQSQLNSRIAVQERTPGAVQRVHHAAIYILHLPSLLPEIPARSVSDRILAELRAHIGVLRSGSATMILIAQVLPEPGTVEREVEFVARLRDLTFLQLANEHEIEMLELVNLVNSVKDGVGQLAVINRHRGSNPVTIALEIQYQTV